MKEVLSYALRDNSDAVDRVKEILNLLDTGNPENSTDLIAKILSAIQNPFASDPSKVADNINRFMRLSLNPYFDYVAYIDIPANEKSFWNFVINQFAEPPRSSYLTEKRLMILKVCWNTYSSFGQGTDEAKTLRQVVKQKVESLIQDNPLRQYFIDHLVSTDLREDLVASSDRLAVENHKVDDKVDKVMMSLVFFSDIASMIAIHLWDKDKKRESMKMVLEGLSVSPDESAKDILTFPTKFEVEVTMLGQKKADLLRKISNDVLNVPDAFKTLFLNKTYEGFDGFENRTSLIRNFRKFSEIVSDVRVPSFLTNDYKNKLGETSVESISYLTNKMDTIARYLYQNIGGNQAIRDKIFEQLDEKLKGFRPDARDLKKYAEILPLDLQKLQEMIRKSPLYQLASAIAILKVKNVISQIGSEIELDVDRVSMDQDDDEVKGILADLTGKYHEPQPAYQFGAEQLSKEYLENDAAMKIVNAVIGGIEPQEENALTDDESNIVTHIQVELFSPMFKAFCRCFLPYESVVKITPGVFTTIRAPSVSFLKNKIKYWNPDLFQEKDQVVVTLGGKPVDEKEAINAATFYQVDSSVSADEIVLVGVDDRVWTSVFRVAQDSADVLSEVIAEYDKIRESMKTKGRRNNRFLYFTDRFENVDAQTVKTSRVIFSCSVNLSKNIERCRIILLSILFGPFCLDRLDLPREDMKAVIIGLLETFGKNLRFIRVMLQCASTWAKGDDMVTVYRTVSEWLNSNNQEKIESQPPMLQEDGEDDVEVNVKTISPSAPPAGAIVYETPPPSAPPAPAAQARASPAPVPASPAPALAPAVPVRASPAPAPAVPVSASPAPAPAPAVPVSASPAPAVPVSASLAPAPAVPAAPAFPSSFPSSRSVNRSRPIPKPRVRKQAKAGQRKKSKRRRTKAPKRAPRAPTRRRSPRKKTERRRRAVRHRK